MKNEVASLMNNEKLMKIFAVAKINRNYSLFTIHYSLFISYIIKAEQGVAGATPCSAYFFL